MNLPRKAPGKPVHASSVAGHFQHGGACGPDTRSETGQRRAQMRHQKPESASRVPHRGRSPTQNS